jgi:hypothetical protein
MMAAVARWLKALLVEHSLAQHAASLAALPRRNQRSVRDLYHPAGVDASTKSADGVVTDEFALRLVETN